MKVRGIVSLMVVFFVGAVIATSMSCGGESDSGDDETQIVSTDCDSDGLRDYDEINNYGTDPCDKDTDEDNLPDGLEVEKGTDPLVFNVGDPKAEPVKEISSSDNHSTIAWTGSEYGIAWFDERDGNKEIYFTTMDRYGQKTASDIRITNNSRNSVKPSLAWSGSNFGLAWRQKYSNQETYFFLLDDKGNKISAETRISYGDHASSEAALSWIGSMFCLAWQDQRDNTRDIYFASLTDDANIVTSETSVIASDYQSISPSLAWAGNEFGLAWSEDRVGHREIYFTTVHPFGDKKSSEKRITYDSNASTMPHIAFNGNDYGLLWHDTRDGSRELYFKRLDIDGTALINDIPITTTSGDPKGFMLWNGEALWYYLD